MKMNLWEWFGSKTRFETEAKVNSEMDYWFTPSLCRC